MNTFSAIFVFAFCLFWGAALGMRISESSHMFFALSIFSVLALAYTIPLFLKFGVQKKGAYAIAAKRGVLFTTLTILGMVVFLLANIEKSGFFQSLIFGEASLLLGILASAIILIGSTGVGAIIILLRESPTVLPEAFVRRASYAALVVSLVGLSIFPTNFLAKKYNYKIDFSFFKTASPGGTTLALVNNATSPFVVRVFSGASSEVGIELENYFHALERKTDIVLEIIDQPTRPALSNRLKIRENGYISISTQAIEAGEKNTILENGNQRAIRPQTIRIGNNIREKRVREKLRDLDTYVRKSLIALERGRLNAYVTTGHGELQMKGKQASVFHKIRILKEGLETYNFNLKPYGSADGLAARIPDNADVLMMVGPDFGISESEFKTIKEYLLKGGSLLLALEPPELRQQKPLSKGKDYTDDLIKWMGLEFEKGILLSKSGIQPITRSKQDRMHFITDQFSAHPAIRTINRDSSNAYGIFLSKSGAFKEVDGAGKTKALLKSPSGSWMELDGDIEPGEKERRQSRPVVVAVEGKDWRAVVSSDATLFSDFAMQNTGNQQFSLDLVNWLTKQEALSGKISSEEDVAFSPTKEGQGIWFYTSVVVIPFFFLILGGWRLSRRKTKIST